MARPRAFNETAVLTQAMHAFRHEGFAGVSIRDLERATGLTSGSLYNAYRDKSGLFEAAFAFYVSAFVRPRIELYAGPGATLDDLENLFLSLLEAPMTDGGGCLATNSAVEFGPAPSIASKHITDAWAPLEENMRALIAREISSAHAQETALRLLLLYQGMLVLSRAGRFDQRRGDVIRAEFDRLRALRKPNG
ncbi:MAG: TetR/AcrR family transcriptional regulator [Hyphomonadaceae bacterium]